MASARPPTSDWEYPLIPNFGAVKPLPSAEVQPEPDLAYKVVFDVSKPAEAKDKISPALVHVARFVNLLGLRGMRPEAASLVVVFHGRATEAVLDDANFRAKNGIDNPNLDLIQRLADCRVELFVCGQALAEQGLIAQWVSPDVKIALSALTVLTNYQLRGYALVPN